VPALRARLARRLATQALRETILGPPGGWETSKDQWPPHIDALSTRVSCQRPSELRLCDARGVELLQHETGVYGRDMAQKLPKRTKQHRRDDRTQRVWAFVLPNSWTYAPTEQREYGIDGRVELFDGDDTTGLIFNVQLKGTDKTSESTAPPIKTTTRNYWKSLDLPTLVVLVDASENVHYEWAHKLDVYGRRENAAKYVFELPNTWDGASVAAIEREVKASRAAKNLHRNLPVLWTLNVDPDLSDPWTRRLKVTTERLLGQHRELTRKPSEANESSLAIDVLTTDVSVRLGGMPGGVLHYGSSLKVFDPESIAVDIALAVSEELGRVGLKTDKILLTRNAISASAMLGADPDFTIRVAEHIVKYRDADLATALVETVYLDEARPAGIIAMLPLIRDSMRFELVALSHITQLIEKHAATQSADEAAASYLYNAGQLIMQADPSRGLALHVAAAERDELYLGRAYWWRERGTMLFEAGRHAEAALAYKVAVDLHDMRAVPLLADTYAFMGRYAEAVSTWDDMRDVVRFIWVLKMYAVDHICDILSLPEQKRNILEADTLVETGANGLTILETDALNWQGLWRAARERLEAKEPGHAFLYVAAACFARTLPVIWFEAILAVNAEMEDNKERTELSQMILTAAVQETGDAFRQFILEDDRVPHEWRKLADLAEDVEDTKEPFIVRHNGEAFI
jgi:tetratricopeptide (TPR) repeat protein